MIPFFFILACAQSEKSDDTHESHQEDSSVENTPTSEPEAPQGLVGTQPPEALDAPEFTALNSDGTTRTRDNLVGTPTVMWFFPAADTPG